MMKGSSESAIEKANKLNLIIINNVGTWEMLCLWKLVKRSGIIHAAGTLRGHRVLPNDKPFFLFSFYPYAANPYVALLSLAGNV